MGCDTPDNAAIATTQDSRTADTVERPRLPPDALRHRGKPVIALRIWHIWRLRHHWATRNFCISSYLCRFCRVKPAVSVVSVVSNLLCRAFYFVPAGLSGAVAVARSSVRMIDRQPINLQKYTLFKNCSNPQTLMNIKSRRLCPLQPSSPQIFAKIAV